MKRFALLSGFLRIVIAATFAATASQAQVTHFSADAAAQYRRVSQAEPPAGADVVILEDEETYTFDNAGRARRSNYLVYQIITQRGAESWADVSISWEPWHEESPSIRARVISPDNMNHALDNKTITDAPAKESETNVFSDQRVMRAPLPAIAPGSIVEEEETVQQTPSFLGAGVVERRFFGRRVPVKHTSLILDAPASLPLRYDLQLLPDLKPLRSESDGRLRITFDSGPINPLDEAESDLPSDVPSYPSVAFSTGESWQQIAEEYSKIVDRQIASADLKTLTDQVTAGLLSRDEKAAAILQYIDRKIRYTGVEFGEATVVPRTPTETLTRTYGDCKDKAALVVAMFRTAGIPAYVSLLRAGTRQDVPSDLPGIGMFDHAIVYVPGATDVWIDATDEYARLGQLPVADQNHLALIARPSSKGLVRIPSSSSADNIIVEKREFHLAEYGPAHVIETTQPHGIFESSYRETYANRGNKTITDSLTNYVKSQYLAEKLDRIDGSDPTDISKPFELVLESDRSKRGFSDLEICVAAIRLDGLFNRLPSYLQQRETPEKPDSAVDASKESRKKRTADYQIPGAFVTEWQYTIIPPPGFRPKPLPPNANLSLGPASLSEEYTVGADNVVRATIRFEMVKNRLTVPEATELRDKVAQLEQGEAILVYFEPIGEALVNEGKVREGLKSYRDLVALYPKEAIYHLRIAKALLAAGMGEPARSEAKAAVGLEPNSALAEKTLAEIFEYDSVGRKLRPGSDYTGAEAAYRAAEKLDPSDKATVANLAILLEFNRWGLHYGPGARLIDAVAEYHKLSAEDLAELGISNNLAYALFYAAQFPEARKNAETLNPQPDALIVACEAAIAGSRAGLAEARKRTAGDEQFRQMVITAGQMMANLRKYSVAADFLEAGASGSITSDTAADAITYRKTQPHEQILLPDDPTGVALRYELLEDSPDLTLDQLKSISSRNGKLAFAIPETVEALVAKERATFSSSARDGEFPDIGIDMSLARAQPKLEGNDGTGYKITLWPSASYKYSIYIVREENKYKVLATSKFTVAIGLETLDRLAAKDLIGARALLNWLREDKHLPSGDDPLSGEAFPRIWTKGKNADAAMKLAAASILVGGKQTASQGITILESARNSTSNETDKTNIEIALLAGYETDPKMFEKALAVAVDLANRYPDASQPFINRAALLRELGRVGEVDKLAEDRLRSMPGDVDAMHAFAFNASFRGDFAKAHALFQDIVANGKADFEDLNSVAWLSLFTGRVESSDVEDVLKATQLRPGSYAILHTLGCLYAEVGKTKEAHEVLLQAMDALDLDEPDDNYWYAFGRIAEQYGETETAIADYSRVGKPEYLPDSTYQLAQIRVQILRSQK